MSHSSLLFTRDDSNPGARVWDRLSIKQDVDFEHLQASASPSATLWRIIFGASHASRTPAMMKVYVTKRWCALAIALLTRMATNCSRRAASMVTTLWHSRAIPKQYSWMGEVVTQEDTVGAVAKGTCATMAPFPHWPLGLCMVRKCLFKAPRALFTFSPLHS